MFEQKWDLKDFGYEEVYEVIRKRNGSSVERLRYKPRTSHPKRGDKVGILNMGLGLHVRAVGVIVSSKGNMRTVKVEEVHPDEAKRSFSSYKTGETIDVDRRLVVSCYL